MEANNSIEIFRCLGDKSRLNIINLLIEGPMYVELLSESLSLAPSTVSFHLKKLEKANLVHMKKDQYYSIYSLNKDIFDVTIEKLIIESYSEKNDLKKRINDFENRVIKSFFAKGRLTKIPIQRKKRVVVLKKIISNLSADKEYTEKEINDLIHLYYDDHCTLRRWLIEDKLLIRNSGMYMFSKNTK